MENFKAGLIVFGLFCLYEVSEQAVAFSAEEKSVGLSIAKKLDSLMAPKFSRAFSSKGWSRGLKRTSLQKQYLDFQLVLDSSGSIGSSKFDKAKGAVKVIVDYINGKSPLSPTGSRVALIEFSSPSKTKLVFSLGDHDYAWDVKNAINNVNYDHGPSTATALALRKARTEFLQNGVSRNAKVVWILTDGKSNTGGSPIPPASQLKSMGVTVCAVAVGSRVNMVEINAIASSGCVYKVTSFTAYKRAMQYAMKSGGAPAAAPVLDPDFFKGIKF